MNRYIHAIFCDDIREEKSNKLILIGVYGSALLVSEFPTILPQLAISLTIVTPQSQPFRSVQVIVKRDEEILIELAIPNEDLVGHQDASAAQSSDDELPNGMKRVSMLSSVLKLSPLVLTGPCVIRVIAETEAGQLRCPALQISTLPQALS